MNAQTVGGLFDGCGLLAYGLHLAGWEHAWLCEVDPWRRELLALRWPGVRIYDDVRAVDARAERPLLIAGGFPCKGASTAGKRTGFDHPETVLWREMASAIRELRPQYVLVENVANILGVRDGAVWGEVLGDLASLGFDVAWDCIPAAAFGAPHLRDRVIAIATNTESLGERESADEAHAVSGSRDARAQPGRRGRSATADAEGEHRQAGGPAGRSLGGAEGGGLDAAADSSRGRREDGEAEHSPQSARPDADLDGRGVSVEWGKYRGAIERWERVAGPAPEPLVRRVDDRRTRRMERSRLSALGDGVQVQLGRLAGEYILGLERERLAA